MMEGARFLSVQRQLCQIGSVKGPREAWQIEVDVQKHDGPMACAVCCSSVRQQWGGVLGQVWELPAAQAVLPRAGAAHCARMHRGPCQPLQAPHCAGVWPAPSSRQLTISEKKAGHFYKFCWKHTAAHATVALDIWTLPDSPLLARVPLQGSLVFQGATILQDNVRQSAAPMCPLVSITQKSKEVNNLLPCQ